MIESCPSNILGQGRVPVDGLVLWSERSAPVIRQGKNREPLFSNHLQY